MIVFLHGSTSRIPLFLGLWSAGILWGFGSLPGSSAEGAERVGDCWRELGASRYRG